MQSCEAEKGGEAELFYTAILYPLVSHGHEGFFMKKRQTIIDRKTVEEKK